MKRLLVAAAIAVTCAVPSREPPRLGAEDAVVVALPAEPEHLFAPAATSPEALAVLGALTDGLVVEDEEGNLEPRLAERVPTLENGDVSLARLADGRALLSVRFRLREGARWHDGSPVRPADLRFGWLLYGRRDVPIAYRGMASHIQDVRGLDERTVEVVYEPGFVDPQYALCCNAFVLPEAHLRDASPERLKESPFARAPVYAGPFAVKEWRAGGGIVLERSPHYPLGPARLRSIAFVVVEPDAASAELAAHRVDVATAGLLGPERGGELADLRSHGVRALLTPTLALAHLDFNLRDATDLSRPHPILGDRRVRAAIAQAIDRDGIAREATLGTVGAAYSFIPPPSWGAAAPADVTRFSLDRAAAERALDEAGWRRGADGVRSKGPVRMQLRFVVATGARAREQAAQRIADDLRAVGIETALDPLPLARLTMTGTGPLALGSFDLALYTWVGGRDPASWSALYLDRAIPTAQNGYVGQNYPGWRDERFSSLAEAAAGSLERHTRRRWYLEMQRIWTDALPALPLYQRVQVDAADARLQELRPLPTRQPITWNAARWSWAGRL